MFKYKYREKEYQKEYRKTYHKKLNGKCKCITCKKKFKVVKYREKTSKFCSFNCYWKYLKGKPNPILKNYEKTRIGQKNPFFGKKHTIKTKNLISNSRKGKCLGELNANWAGGKSFEEYGKEFDNYLKEQVRFRDKYKCRICGCSQLENGRQLDVHHIDYNKKNNNFDNLISLCIGCHSKTTTNNRKQWMKYFKDCAKSQWVQHVLGVDYV